jgi:hypothetical protein
MRRMNAQTLDFPAEHLDQALLVGLLHEQPDGVHPQTLSEMQWVQKLGACKHAHRLDPDAVPSRTSSWTERTRKNPLSPSRLPGRHFVFVSPPRPGMHPGGFGTPRNLEYR